MIDELYPTTEKKVKDGENDEADGEGEVDVFGTDQNLNDQEEDKQEDDEKDDEEEHPLDVAFMKVRYRLDMIYPKTNNPLNLDGGAPSSSGIGCKGK